MTGLELKGLQKAKSFFSSYDYFTLHLSKYYDVMFVSIKN